VDFFDGLFSGDRGDLLFESLDGGEEFEDHHEALIDFGRTGKAGFALAVTLAQKEKMIGKHFLVPVFDAAWHYDN
jgi:hypothetical protein